MSDFLQSGYNVFLQKEPLTQQQGQQQLTEFDFDLSNENISGSKLASGKFVSRSGRLQIDLDNDILSYSDGKNELFKLGGQTQLLLKNTEGDILYDASKKAGFFLTNNIKRGFTTSKAQFNQTITTVEPAWTDVNNLILNFTLEREAICIFNVHVLTNFLGSDSNPKFRFLLNSSAFPSSDEETVFKNESILTDFIADTTETAVTLASSGDYSYYRKLDKGDYTLKAQITKSLSSGTLTVLGQNSSINYLQYLVFIL